ncbi:MAG: divalent-cation tolerance protein CutA [Proteobacteria bacterium]|nr:MAG: divalent-cation tolerance protein CutA [Pseudomonadota bacterium]
MGVANLVNARSEPRLVLVTCDKLREARRIAGRVVGQKLAACVNLLPGPVESIYRWQGKVEKAREWLLVIKTTQRRLPALEKEVKRLHSYDVPEFIVLPIDSGSKDYLGWLARSVD